MNKAKFSAIFLIAFLFFYNSINFAQVRFVEDFENDLSNWIIEGENSINIIRSTDVKHGKVLELTPGGVVYALVKNSDQWGSVRIEADILFPDDKHNYLGLIYNYTKDENRVDFGGIYIKGNGSYIRVNPWRDNNASRLLYEEYRTLLKDDQAIKIKKWHRIKAEIKNNVCHFYVNDMNTPKLTFDLFENNSGLMGFKPRIVGWPVWVDNVKITSIDQMSYEGPNIPNILYQPDSLLTDWEVLGPVKKPLKEIEFQYARQELMSNGKRLNWTKFDVDRRGAVLTGKITEFSGERTIAYFRTNIESDMIKDAILHFSTVDELALWVNGVFFGFVYRDGYISTPYNDWNAWYDFWENPEHEGRKVDLELKKGINEILIRVRNGQFASGGFFARLEIP